MNSEIYSAFKSAGSLYKLCLENSGLSIAANDRFSISTKDDAGENHTQRAVFLDCSLVIYDCHSLYIQSAFDIWDGNVHSVEMLAPDTATGALTIAIRTASGMDQVDQE